MKNKKTITILISAVLVITIIAIILVDSRKTPARVAKINPAFAQYISAYTSGLISTESEIRIRLAQDYATEEQIGKEADASLFKFNPSISGKAVWEDSRTIAFIPDEKLPYKQPFIGKFMLNNLLDVPRELRKFKFFFQTMAQTFSMKVENVKPYDVFEMDKEKLTGSIRTSDYSDNEAIEKVITATQDGKNLNIRWEHSPGSKTHKFIVDSITRKKTKETVELQWNTESIGLDEKGSKHIEIPPLGVFKLMKARVEHSPEQCAILQFSDPLMEDQDLKGLIKLGNQSRLDYVIEDNEIRVYTSSRQTGQQNITVYPEVKNIDGKRLGQQYTEMVNFEEIKPAVELVGKGVILPNSRGLLFPFKAVNLRAVDVTILKIYEDNIAQFLQVNNLKGSRELSRVGKVVLKKKVPLISKDAIDYGQWNRFSLDLANLIEAEPGAIYKVTLGFKRSYSLYHCQGEDKTDKDVEMVDMESEITEDYYSETGYDDYYNDYYYYDSYYNYKDRQNPCKDAYYGRRREVSKNILASDIGLIAKRGENGEFLVTATDLRTTEPINNVTLELYNYQQRLIGETETGNDGKATIKLKEKAFLLIARNNSQRGYLKLDDGSSLSLSKFDVSGVSKKKGLNGYIYGERGVWRPGDSLFLTFILEDKERELPGHHPVIFELKNPKGNIINKQVQKLNKSGFYAFKTATHPDAITGNYNATVKVGGATFYKTIKIETIKPNRLKIDLEFNKDKLTTADRNEKGILTVKWLHGAVGRNLKTKVDVTLNKAYAKFKNYEDYIFNDPARSFYPETQTIFDSRLNENGKATIYPEFYTNRSAPGVLSANFVIKAFEEGGNFSIDRFSIPYYPYESFVGMKAPEGDKYTGRLSTDSIHKIEIVNIDAEGKPMSSNNLEVEVYKVRWRWWWDRSGDNLGNYINSSYHKPLQKEQLRVRNGKAVFDLKIEYPEWGRYLVRVCDKQSGHCTGETLYIDWPGWASRMSKDNSTAASMLTFSANKEKFNVGEKVKLTIPSPTTGRALISIESGTKVVQSYWKQLEKGETHFEFPTTKEMAPNVYVHITLIQPHAQNENDLPIRLYGVIPIYVEDPETHLHPVVSMPEVMRPEKEATVKVKEKNGQAMTYTLAIVDEGLLDLTRFSTPKPWEHFYARQALGVKTWDLYDYVMGAYGGQLERILSIGGGGDMPSRPEGAKANRFKPMVKFIGPCKLDKGENQTHVIDIPQYVGSVRTMVIAGHDGAYGSTEATTPVRNPLMILGTLPRVIGPGEEVNLPITVFAMEEKIKNVNISIKTNDKFKILGQSSKNISFNKTGDQVVYFKLKVKQALGIGEVEMLAKSGNETAKHDIEIDVRNPNPPMVTTIDTVIESGNTWITDYEPIGMKGTNTGMIEVSSIPPLNLGRRLKFLLNYPHGCVEQTTSAVFPQLYLDKLMDVNTNTKTMIEKNVKAAIKRLVKFQTSDGGFAYWPGKYESDPWGTCYAGHFILEAEKQGYTLPGGMKHKWIKHQRKQARRWSGTKNRYYNTEIIQAYRLYTLALAGKPELGAMNRLREMEGVSFKARWRLAATYQLAGKESIAKNIITNLSTEVKDYRELSYTYGSGTRDKAMILETISMMDMRSKGAMLVKQISEKLSSSRWLSTQTTAYCLMAMAKFIKEEDMSKQIKFTYSINNSKSIDVLTEIPLVQKEFDITSTGNGQVKIENTGKGMLYARVILEGTPIAGQEQASFSNLQLSIKYTTTTGGTINPARIEQGTDFVAHVAVTNPGIMGDYKEMALTQIFPSGWEIHNTRMDDFSSSQTSSFYNYQDIRDDRVYTYFDLREYKTKSFKVMLNASYAGKYYMPAVNCEAMYDATIHARNQGQWVVVEQWE